MFIDPFGDMRARLAARGLEFAYPPIEGVEADLLLVTHEHGDHNGVEVIGGDPAGPALDGGHARVPLGEVVGIASEHDAVAGTQRGPNTIFRFALDGTTRRPLRRLRPAGAAAGATRGDRRRRRAPPPGRRRPDDRGARAAALVRELRPRLVVPMHYRTPGGRTSSTRPTRSSTRSARASSGWRRARPRSRRCSAAARSPSSRCSRRRPASGKRRVNPGGDGPVPGYPAAARSGSGAVVAGKTFWDRVRGRWWQRARRLACLAGAARPATTTFDRTRTIRVNGRPTFPLVLSPAPTLGSTTPWGTDGLAETVSAGANVFRTGAGGSGGRRHPVGARLGSGGGGSPRLHVAEPQRLLAGAGGLDSRRGSRTRRRHAHDDPSGSAIAMWKGRDEPWWSNIAPSALQFAYCRVTSRGNPFWCQGEPRSTRASSG